MARLTQQEYVDGVRHARGEQVEWYGEQVAEPARRVGVCATDGCERLAHPEGGGYCAGCYRRRRGK